MKPTHTKTRRAGKTFRDFSIQWKKVFHSVENFSTLWKISTARAVYSLMWTTVAGGKPLNQVEEAWL